MLLTDDDDEEEDKPKGASKKQSKAVSKTEADQIVQIINEFDELANDTLQKGL